eukprot:6452306-Amphidinium_carterae.1
MESWEMPEVHVVQQRHSLRTCRSFPACCIVVFFQGQNSKCNLALQAKETQVLTSPVESCFVCLDGLRSTWGESGAFQVEPMATKTYVDERIEMLKKQ